MNREVIKNFKGSYNIIGKIYVQKEKCTICGEYKTCLHSDGSENELVEAYLYPECVIEQCRKFDFECNKIHISSLKNWMI